MSLLQDINVSEEVQALAEYHLDILKRRFPDHKHQYHDEFWVRIEKEGCSTIFVIVFSEDSVRILTGREGEIVPPIDETIDYADPRFTDDTLSEIIERVEEELR